MDGRAQSRPLRVYGGPIFGSFGRVSCHSRNSPEPITIAEPITSPMVGTSPHSAKPKMHRPDQREILERHHRRGRRQMDRARPPVLSEHVADAVADDQRHVAPARRHEKERQRQAVEHRQPDQLVDGQRLGQFRPRHAAHADGDGAEQDRIAERVERADLEGLAAGAGDDQHADKADHQRGPARPSDRLLEEKHRGQGGKQRRREIDRGGAGERHHAERDQQQGLRGELRHAAEHVSARPPRVEHRQAFGRQRIGGKQQQGDEHPAEQHLAGRVGGDQPFRGGAGEGEDRAGRHHVEDRQRNPLLPRRRLGDGPFGAVARGHVRMAIGFGVAGIALP